MAAIKTVRFLTTPFEFVYPLSVVIGSWNLEIQRGEDAVTNLRNQIYINSCSGSNMDDLAKLFRLPRNTGEADSEYRQRIKGYFQSAISFGTKDNLKSALASLLSIDESDVTITELSALIIKIEIPVPFDLDLVDAVSETISTTKAAGVYVREELEFTKTENVTVTSVSSATQLNAFQINNSRLGDNDVIG